MEHADFVHLHVLSQYSLLDGACHLEELMAHLERFLNKEICRLRAALRSGEVNRS